MHKSLYTVYYTFGNISIYFSAYFCKKRKGYKKNKPENNEIGI